MLRPLSDEMDHLPNSKPVEGVSILLPKFAEMLKLGEKTVITKFRTKQLVPVGQFRGVVVLDIYASWLKLINTSKGKIYKVSTIALNKFGAIHTIEELNKAVSWVKEQHCKLAMVSSEQGFKYKVEKYAPKVSINVQQTLMKSGYNIQKDILTCVDNYQHSVEANSLPVAKKKITKVKFDKTNRFVIDKKSKTKVNKNIEEEEDEEDLLDIEENEEEEEQDEILQDVEQIKDEGTINKDEFYPSMDTEEAVRLFKIYQAKQAKLKYLKASGTVVPRETIENMIECVTDELKKRLLNIPVRVCAYYASVLYVWR
jgi:phage terminase Nu1 subunit (DNA packaging protein)